MDEQFASILDRAQQLLADGRPEEALHLLDELDPSLLDTDDQHAWISLRAAVLAELGRMDAALELLDKALEESPESARLLSTLGVILANVDELEEACEVLEDALQLEPDNAFILMNIAGVYERLRDFPRATEFYEKSLAAGADLEWVLPRLASMLVEAGRYAEAKATLKRYLSVLPDDVEQWIALGVLHNDDGEYEAAYECFRAAERVNPDSPQLRLNWGVSAVCAKDLKAAYQQLAALKALDPKGARWWLLRAFILEEEGNLAGAREIYERVVARRRFNDQAELTYALEMAMDFFARRHERPRCSRLLQQAYALNACTVELCEAYREVAGHHVDRAYWFSLLIEADYREGLSEVRQRGRRKARRYTRFVRDYQVVARDHDEAVGLVLDFAKKMGEKNASIREFIGIEPIENAHTGIYEVEPESYVFSGENEAEEEPEA